MSAESGNAVPCVVFAFNRPNKLQRVLAALREQGVPKLYVFVDGPRDERDVAAVNECRKIAKAIDWVHKETVFYEKNRQFEGMPDDWASVLERHRAAAILEDDCLPMPGFYSFMCRALDHYEPEARVFAIGGYQYLPSRFFRHDTHSMMSTWRFTGWGWATWRDRWQALDPYRLRFAELFDGLGAVPGLAGPDLRDSACLVKQGQVAAWDIQVAIAMLRLRQVMLLPTKGLVRNIGLEQGTHGRAGWSWFHNVNVERGEGIESLIWLKDVAPRPRYVEALNKHVRCIRSPTVIRRIWRKLVRSQVGTILSAGSHEKL